MLKDAATLRELARVPLGQAAEARWQAPYLVAHRADLQAALLAQVAERPEIELVTGARVTGIAVNAHDVAVIGRRDGRAIEARGKLLIGADGVWSAVRTQLAGKDFGESRFSGELAWRATVAADSAAGEAFATIGAADCVTTFLHPGFHMVAYPVSKGRAFNLAAFTKGERWPKAGRAMPTLRSSRRLPCAAPRRRLAKLVALAGPWTAFPIHTVDQSGGRARRASL